MRINLDPSQHFDMPTSSRSTDCHLPQPNASSMTNRPGNEIPGIPQQGVPLYPQLKVTAITIDVLSEGQKGHTCALSNLSDTISGALTTQHLARAEKEVCSRL